MKFTANNIYHVYNQGNKRQPIFLSPNHYLIFLKETRICILPHAEFIAYCLMPNHFHFLIHTDERCNISVRQGGLMLDPITNGIRKLLSAYTKIFNAGSNRSGSLFRQKTKAKCLSEYDSTLKDPLYQRDCFMNSFHYIHQNPLKAGLAKDLEQWEFSSYKDYAGLRNGSLCTRNLAAAYCGYTVEDFINESYRLLPDDVAQKII